MKTILLAILFLSLLNLHAGEKGNLASYQAKFTKAEQSYQEILITEKSSLAVKAYQALQKVNLAYRKAGKLNELLATRELLKEVALKNSLLIDKTSKLKEVNAVLSSLKISVSKKEQQYQLSIQKLQKSYVAALKRQVIALTQQDKIEEALKIKAELKKIEAAMSPIVPKTVALAPTNIKQVKLVPGKDLMFGTIKLKPIKPGSFMMGSPVGEAKRGDSEFQHKVTLSRGFWMGQYEVTQKQWQSIMGRNPSKFIGENNPVEQISWGDCQVFITKLNTKYKNSLPEGYEFSLPTEAQWEYACRAGSTTAYNCGDNLTKSEANFSSKLKATTSVGSYRANAWGLYDMHGNVFEWCQDWLGSYPQSAVTDPVGPGKGSSRVFRGGGWFLRAWDCRSANRAGRAPRSRHDGRGLRLALVALQFK